MLRRCSKTMCQLFLFQGVDLIADVFPAVLDKHKNVQLIAVGPVIDLHGKFAALKLDFIAKQYPGRVYSKPEFTALPPFIFSEFSLKRSFQSCAQHGLPADK